MMFSSRKFTGSGEGTGCMVAQLEDLVLCDPDQLRCRSGIRIEAHMQLCVRGNLDHPRQGPQCDFDPTRGCWIAFQCRVACRQAAIRHIQLCEERKDTGVPIEGNRLAIGPVRQLGFAHACGRTLCDGIGEPNREGIRDAVRQAVVHRRGRPGGVEHQCADLIKPQDAARKAPRQRLATRPENPLVGNLEDARTGSRGRARDPCGQASAVPAYG